MPSQPCAPASGPLLVLFPRSRAGGWAWATGRQHGGRRAGGHLLLLLDGLDPLHEELLLPVLVTAHSLLLWQHLQLLQAAALACRRLGALGLEQGAEGLTGPPGGRAGRRGSVPGEERVSGAAQGLVFCGPGFLGLWQESRRNSASVARRVSGPQHEGQQRGAAPSMHFREVRTCLAMLQEPQRAPHRDPCTAAAERVHTRTPS